MNQRQTLGEILIAFGEYYDKRLTPTQLAMYVEDLMTLSPDELRGACILYRQDPKNDRFPLPSRLIGLVRPVASAEDVGRETVSRIIDAVFKCGWNNSDRAKATLGEFEWSVVKRMGGWANFCQELTNENLPTIRAQVRDLAMTMKRMEKIAPIRTDNAIEDTVSSKLISDFFNSVSSNVEVKL